MACEFGVLVGIAAVFLSTGCITLHVMRANWREFQLSATAEQNYDTVRERERAERV